MDYVIDFNCKQKKLNKDKCYLIRKKILEGKKVSKDEMYTFLDMHTALLKKELRDKYNICNDDPLINKCSFISNFMYNNLRSDTVNVYQRNTLHLFKETCFGHSFLVCFIQDVPFLVDLSYRQFFIKERCFQEQISNDIILISKLPGAYMVDERGKRIARSLLSNGYIALDKEVAKRYGDSFNNAYTGKKRTIDITGSKYYSLLTRTTLTKNSHERTL